MIAVNKIQDFKRSLHLCISWITDHGSTVNIKLFFTNAYGKLNLKTDKRTYLSSDKFILLVAYSLHKHLIRISESKLCDTTPVFHTFRFGDKSAFVGKRVAVLTHFFNERVHVRNIILKNEPVYHISHLYFPRITFLSSIMFLVADSAVSFWIFDDVKSVLQTNFI